MNNIIVKLFDLLYLTFIYVISGVIIGSLTEKIFVKLYGHLNNNINKYNKKSTTEIIIEIIVQMFIVSIIYFYCKSFLLNIPIIKISDNISLAKSYDLTIIFTFSFFSLQQNLEDKYIYLLNRMNNYNLKIPSY